MSNILRFSNANPLRMVITEFQYLNPLEREAKFFKDFSLPNFDSFFQPVKDNEPLVIQFDSSFSPFNRLEIVDYKTGVVVDNTIAPNVIKVNADYTVFEHEVDNLLDGFNGLYFIVIRGLDSDGKTYRAESEPFEVKPSHCDTVRLEYRNNETAFGIDYENSPVIFSMRMPALFNRTADESEVELFKDSGGNSSLISSKGTRTRVLKATKLLPQWFIEKVNLILLHDVVSIDGVAVSADQQLPYELISDRQLWSEPEAPIVLASGSSNYINSHEI